MDKKLPLVSVITGVYNPPPILFKKYIESCINSTLDFCEFIFILDDPTDTISKSILDEYKVNIQQSKHTFVIQENTQNLGIIPTYNIGMKFISGEYTIFFDSDDFFDIDFLEVMYNYAKEHSLDLLSGYSITHWFDDTSTFPLEFMQSLNNDVWVNLFKSSTLIDNGISYVDDPIIMLNKLNSIKNVEIDTLPLEKGVFYHYVRNQKSISSYNLEESLISIKDHILTMENNLNLTKHKFNSISNMILNKKD